MTKDTTTYPVQEPYAKNLLCWRSIFGGLLVALMVFITLAALGAGIGGFIGEQLISRENGALAFATGSGLYLGLSVALALLFGSYFALRLSHFVTTRVGAAHGLIIASTFFILMVLGLGNVIGGLASGLSSLAKTSASGAAMMSMSNVVQDSINQTLGTSTLKSDPKDVVQGLTTRLVQGDYESAKNYLAYQTGQSKTEVETKISDLTNQINTKTKIAAEQAARAAGSTGIALFILFLVGLMAAVIGGGAGAHANITRPFTSASGQSSVTFEKLQPQHGGVAPYVLGWILGIPISILLLMALLRSIF